MASSAVAASDKYKRKASGKNSVMVKVGMVGDSEVGKTSLMVKYVENKFDEDYICTLGMLLAPIQNKKWQGIIFFETTN